ETALRESQALNQAVLGSLVAHIAVLDRDGNIIAVNEAWKRFARENGGAAFAVSSAAEAYTLITATPLQERPHVIVTDMGMPGEDGYGMMGRGAGWERPRGSYTPSVAVTAYGRSEDRVRALSAGFQMHVAKPVEPAELAIVITSLVRR